MYRFKPRQGRQIGAHWFESLTLELAQKLELRFAAYEVVTTAAALSRSAPYLRREGGQGWRVGAGANAGDAEARVHVDGRAWAARPRQQHHLPVRDAHELLHHLQACELVRVRV